VRVEKSRCPVALPRKISPFRSQAPSSRDDRRSLSLRPKRGNLFWLGAFCSGDSSTTLGMTRSAVVSNEQGEWSLLSFRPSEASGEISCPVALPRKISPFRSQASSSRDDRRSLSFRPKRGNLFWLGAFCSGDSSAALGMTCPAVVSNEQGK